MLTYSRAYTLIELLVTMVILSILVAFALPNYYKYTRNARLTAAKAALLEDARFMEQFYSKHYSFKKDYQTWPDLPINETQYFKIHFTSIAKYEPKGKYRLKAEAKDDYANTEDRYLEIDEDSRLKTCTKITGNTRCHHD